jgi:putative methyltransferase (TIGR04325 family)
MLGTMALKLSYSLSEDRPSLVWAHTAEQAGCELAAERANTCAFQMLKVKGGEVADFRDGEILQKPQFQFPMLSAMLRQAVINKGKLSVLDVGGMLGTSYFQFLRFSESAVDLLWCIVELDHNVKAGKRYLEDSSLKFHDSIASCIAELRRVPDVALLSGVLQNVESWREMLLEVRDVGAPVIVIDRLTTAVTDMPLLCLQKIERSCGNVTICPMHIIPQKEIDGLLSSKYRLLTTFRSSVDSPFLVGTLPVDYIGSIWLQRV